MQCRSLYPIVQRGLKSLLRNLFSLKSQNCPLLWQPKKETRNAKHKEKVMQTLPNPTTSKAAYSQMSTDGNIQRRKTRPVQVASVTIGGGYPVVVQSMINEDTLDIDGSVAAIRRLHEIGCEIVRVTVPSIAHAQAVGESKQKLIQTYQDVPLVADVHHNGMKIALEVAQHVDKVRINPGLYVFEKPKPTRTEYTQAEFDEIGEKIRETLKPLVLSLKEQGKAMRIGVNHGSLAERMLFTYGDTPEGMVQSAIEFLRICESLDYKNLVISLKASRVPVMVAAYRLMAQRMDELGMDYPLHLGITEAGGLMSGTVKSSIGMGMLLWSGIGDTIRVSLSADPVEEIRVGFDILKSLGLRHRGVNIVSCPSCARQGFDVIKTVQILEDRLKHITTPMSLSIIGCVVNGPGEATQTDIGFTGGGSLGNKTGGHGMVYLDGKQAYKLENDRLVDHIVELCEKRALEIETRTPSRAAE